AARQPFALSTDGKWLVFTESMDVPNEQSGNDGPQADLFKMPVTGGEPERIVRFPARIFDLSFAPDDKSLVLTTDLGGVHYDLWRLDLSAPDKPVKLTFGSADEDRPSLSNDGRWLLFRDNHEGAPALVVRNLKTGADRTLTITKLDFGVPAGRVRLKV